MLKEDLIAFLYEEGMSDAEVEDVFDGSVSLATMVGLYAHRGQVRANGTPYFQHPYRCLAWYRSLVGLREDEYFCIDKELMEECGLPFDGVQEVCLLHDVIEDTPYSVDDLGALFAHAGLGNHFELFMREPLCKVTHNKAEPYPQYMAQVLTNRTAALVKLVDLADNVNPLDLSEWGSVESARMRKYIDCIDMIEGKYAFLKAANRYKAAMRAREERGRS